MVDFADIWGATGASTADLLEPPRLQSHWYCDWPDCDGNPHEGMHWCDHPLVCPFHGTAGAPTGETCMHCHTWQCRHARADQCPPNEFTHGLAHIWLLLAGRGFGKSRSGAEWLAEQMQTHPDTEWALGAPTRDDVQDICIEGESGLLRALGLTRDFSGYNRSKLTIRLPNGALVKSYSSGGPEKVRGANLSGAWLEEIASWSDPDLWDNMLPAIRRNPAKVVIASTPKPVPLVREFTDRTDGSVAITYGSTFDNERNLSKSAIDELRQRWAGTRRERQELFGELLDDVAGALWQASTVDSLRGVLLP